MQKKVLFSLKNLELSKLIAIFAPEKRKKQKKYMKIIKLMASTLSLALVLLLSSCGGKSAKTVLIEGNVMQADGEKLVLYHLTGGNAVIADSVRLKQDGAFKFTPEVEVGGPDYFCLMMENGQSIPLAVDTLQSPIHVVAQKDKFNSDYKVDDALNQRLQKAVAMGNQFRRNLLTRQLPPMQLIAEYKERVLKDYIFADPADPVCYYLLFETVGGANVFSANDPKDLRAYGAVANLWNSVYPNSPRTERLVNLTKQGMILRQQNKAQSALQDSLLKEVKVVESNFPELNLPGTNDKLVSLSSVVQQNKVVIVDFTAYYLDFSPAHNIALHEVYDKLKNQGVTVYQVCMDMDENFWKVSASNMPWTVVCDKDVIYNRETLVPQYCPSAVTYNVGTLPGVVVIGKGGNTLDRVDDMSKLEAIVRKGL